MSGTLDLIGALTVAAGFITAVLVYMTNNLLPWWVPASYLVGGLVTGLLWFALASIIRRLDDIQTVVGRPAK